MGEDEGGVRLCGRGGGNAGVGHLLSPLQSNIVFSCGLFLCRGFLLQAWLLSPHDLAQVQRPPHPLHGQRGVALGVTPAAGVEPGAHGVCLVDEATHS
jgi:hypothetical protein